MCSPIDLPVSTANNLKLLHNIHENKFAEKRGKGTFEMSQAQFSTSKLNAQFLSGKFEILLKKMLKKKLKV